MTQDMHKTKPKLTVAHCWYRSSKQYDCDCYNINRRSEKDYMRRTCMSRQHSQVCICKSTTTHSTAHIHSLSQGQNKKTAVSSDYLYIAIAFYFDYVLFHSHIWMQMIWYRTKVNVVALFGSSLLLVSFEEVALKFNGNIESPTQLTIKHCTLCRDNNPHYVYTSHVCPKISK